MHFVQGNTVHRPLLRSLDLGSWDCVFVLAGTEPGADDPDARTILTALLLADLRRRSESQGAWPRVVAELLDGRNRELLTEASVQDIVVSPQVVSVLMAQVSQLPVLGPVYRELLSAGGIEIQLQAAARYAELGVPTSQRDVVAAAQGALETVLGCGWPGMTARERKSSWRPSSAPSGASARATR